tara:strand:+ start:403 stop:792 length:390 start_codon:yes stop_codon:yes gene_type:complete
MPKPKCDKGYKLVKSRCECKKTQKTTKKTKKKTPKKNKKNKRYQEHWALVKGQYSLNMPSDKQLKVRRRRIDEVYTLYDNIKKVDKSIPHPKNWHSPPEFCYNEQLQNMIKAMKVELKDKRKEKGIKLI